MLATKKNQYALRAIFELARHYGNGPRKISEIARTQAIPVRFLEVILSKLKGSEALIRSSVLPWYPKTTALSRRLCLCPHVE